MTRNMAGRSGTGKGGAGCRGGKQVDQVTIVNNLSSLSFCLEILRDFTEFALYMKVNKHFGQFNNEIYFDKVCRKL